MNTRADNPPNTFDADTLRFVRKLALFGLPLALLILTYIVLDPFMVVRDYDSYIQEFKKPAIRLNRDMVSTETFLRYRSKNQYDSFIFGSSRTSSIKANDWISYIEPAKPFHFDAYGESLLGVNAKIKLIDRINAPMNHVLLVLDEDMLAKVTNPTAHLYTLHPITSGESTFAYQLRFFKAYYTTNFFLEHWMYLLTGKVYPFMHRMIRSYNRKVDPVTNDVYLMGPDYTPEEKIRAERRRQQAFENSRAGNDKAATAIIGPMQRELLEEIARIFAVKKTDLKILIAPGYNQVPMNQEDVRYLRNLFGYARVHDFTGVNYITEDTANFYDPVHTRQKAARAMLADIYVASTRTVSQD